MGECIRRMLAPLTLEGGATSGEDVARIGSYNLVANLGAVRQLCSHYLE